MYTVPYSTAVYEAQKRGMPISHFAPDSSAGIAYKTIAEEVMRWNLKEIENTLKKTSEGNFSARVDENNVATELKTIAQMLNRTLEKAAVAKELKHRADVMIQYNPMAIAILRKDKTRIHINKAYETLWRGTREELLKKKLNDFDIAVLSGEHFYACFETKKLAITDCLVYLPGRCKEIPDTQCHPDSR